jgi:hypothetical protein
VRFLNRPFLIGQSYGKQNWNRELIGMTELKKSLEMEMEMVEVTAVLCGALIQILELLIWRAILWLGL